MTHNMASDQYNADPFEIQTIMATKIQCRSMQRRVKFGHNYQTYNVDLCHTDANLSTTTNIQMCIYAKTHTKTPSQPGESSEWSTKTQGLCFIHKVRFYPCE